MREESKQFMPLWGPYSKKYMGISRVMRESIVPGSRFDLVVYPTYANSSVPVPNVTVPSDYHPWNCDSKGDYFCYRYELQWKDQLFADVDFFKVDDETWGIRVNYENHTDKRQNCLLNFFTAIEYPEHIVYHAKYPNKSEFWNALDYSKFEFAKKRPWEFLNQDGLKKGERIISQFTKGNGLGETWYCKAVPQCHLGWFGKDAGDCVEYKRKLVNQYKNPVLYIRYQTVETNETVIFESNYGTITFEPCKEPTIIKLPLKNVSNEFTFSMVSKGTVSNGINLDFLCITEENEKVEIETEKRNVIPIINYLDDTIEYKYHYGETPIYFNILNKRIRSRKLYSGCLEDALITRLTNSDETYDNLTRSFSGAFMEKHSDEGFYHNSVVEAIFLPGNSSHVEYAYISSKNINYTKEQIEQIWYQRKEKVSNSKINPEGKEFEFSTRLLKSAIYSNVVYPIYRDGEYIVHYTPGKRWDSLYTWDSGFIGLGMLEYSKEHAEYILDVYLSEENNKNFAFLSHGSLVPTQFYLFYEMLMRRNGEGKNQLKKYYNMLKRYYRYMSGKSEGSTMNRLGTGLLTVYDYFYNASGMDDYPPQVAMHKGQLEEYISPVCSNVHFIRIAKIMKEVASYFGYEEDCKEYIEDMKRVTSALLQYGWDEDSGYFGYIIHKESPQETEIFRTSSGENYNKGIDGITPIIAGICTNNQEERMLKHLKSEGELWSKVGLSTVDQSASYFYDNGYWNGSVWFPYQYLIWKAMLDIGEIEFAYQIAQKALTVWKDEVEFSYHTFEMIQIESERGGWFHQFGGLSSPIVNWYHAYFCCGNVTSGYETWIESKVFTDNNTKAQIVYQLNDRKKNYMIVVMNSEYEYDVFINGVATQYEEHIKGALEIGLSEKQGEIVIKRKNEKDIR